MGTRAAMITNPITPPRRLLQPLLVLFVLLLAALVPAQQAVGWGRNLSGEADFGHLTGIVQIAGGGYHSLALLGNGTVVAQGDNSEGQCNVPAGLSGVVQIAAGAYNSVALKSDGTVVAWGSTELGGTVPSGLSNVVQISCEGSFTLALKGDGTVVAWGDNYGGPCDVPAGLAGVRTVRAGLYHSVAVKADNTVVAWGSNFNGQCNVPSGLANVKDIACGGFHTVALKQDGTVVAWGDNTYGKCDVPAGLTNVVQIAASNGHSLALKGDGTMVGWGFNAFGQTDIPVGLKNVKQLVAGYQYSAALFKLGVNLDHTDLYGGESATGTVSKVDVPNGALSIALASSDPAVHVPSTVTLPGRTHSATFPVTTDLVFGDRTATVAATVEGMTATSTLHLKGETATLKTSVASVIGGSISHPQLTVTLGWAPATDLTLSLASSSSAVTLPATVTIPAGTTTVRIPIGHALTATTQTATLTASYGGQAVATASLAVRPATATLFFLPNSVIGAQAATGVLQLNASFQLPMTIGLRSDSPSAWTPSSVTVPGGDRGAVFTMGTYPVIKTTYAPIVATVDGNDFSAKLKIVPGPTLAAITVPTYLYGHQTAMGTVRLREPAPSDGATIRLSATDGVSVPSTVDVVPGQIQATFPITAIDATDNATATVTAVGGAVTIAKSTTVRPLAVAAFSVSSATIVGGTAFTGTVALNVTVNMDTTVQVTSDDPTVIQAPATVTIPAGSKSATFSIATTKPDRAKSVKVTAAKNGTSAFRTVKVTP